MATTDDRQKRGTSLLYTLMAEAREYKDLIVMGRGDPDFDTPPHIIEAAREAMARHGNDYTPPEGILPLRQAIAERVKRINNIDVDPETEVVVTNGGQEALFVMIAATIGPGDELVMPEPNYNTYLDALTFARGVKVGVPTYPEEGFRVDPDRVRPVITSKTRALMMASPNNPSASVIAPDDVRALLQLAQEHDLILLADDIYDIYVYDQYEHLSPASLPGGKERTLTLNAMSKAFSMTGWRVGWIVGPANLMAHVKRIKAGVSGGVSLVAQHAALAALTGPQDAVYAMRDAYIRRRRMVLDVLDELCIQYGMPQGGQFVFADFSQFGISSIDLARKILHEEHVLIYPGASFAKNTENYMRITFLQPEDRLAEAMARIKRAILRLTPQTDLVTAD